MSEIKLIVICTCAVLGPIPKTKEALFFGCSLCLERAREGFSAFFRMDSRLQIVLVTNLW